MASNDENKSERNSAILQPGQVIRPLMTESMAKEMVFDIYGLKVLSVQEFNSYDDRNYHVKVDNEEYNNQHMQQVDPAGYVLKVLNSMDSQKPILIDAQNQLMLYMHNQGININIPMQNIHGNYQSLEKIVSPDGKQITHSITRLLTYLPGVILYNIDCTPELCFQVGKLAAKVDKALEGFHHPAYDNHQSLWMLSNAPKIREFIFAVQPEQHRTMVESILKDFESQVLANLEKLDRGMIHGDINEQNIIVRQSECDSGKYEIHGLLDLGDSQHNCYLFELTIATMYMMLMGNEDSFIEFGSQAITGYVSEHQISELEWNLLKVCIEARYCQSLVMGAYTNCQDSSNTYVLATSRKGWDQLTKFRNTSMEEIHNIWKTTLKIFAK